MSVQRSTSGGGVGFTSLEGARAAVPAGAGGGAGAAEGAVLLPRAGRLLGAGRLVRERAAAQQGGFLRDAKEKWGGGYQDKKGQQTARDVVAALTPFRVV